MSTIDPTSAALLARLRMQVEAQLRTQAGGPIAARRRASAAAGTPATHGPHSHAPGGGAASADAASRQAVALRVCALSPDDPQRSRKAFRFFLESVLVKAIGQGRLDERGFDQLVDAVVQRMDDDAGLRSAMDEAGSLLVAQARKT